MGTLATMAEKKKNKKMGVSESKVTETAVAETINKVITKNLQQISCDSTQHQVINIEHATINGLVVKMGSSCIQKGFFKADNIDKLKTQIAQALTAQVNQDSSSLALGLGTGFQIAGIGFAKANVSETTVSKIVNENLTFNVQNCSDTSTQDQTLNISYANVQKMLLSMDATALITCMFSSENLSNISNNIAQKLDAAVKLNTPSPKFNASILLLIVGFGFMLIMFFIILFAVIIL